MSRIFGDMHNTNREFFNAMYVKWRFIWQKSLINELTSDAFFLIQYSTRI